MLQASQRFEKAMKKMTKKNDEFEEDSVDITEDTDEES